MMLTLATIANIASSIRQSTPKLIPSDGSSFACRSERRSLDMSTPLVIEDVPTLAQPSLQRFGVGRERNVAVKCKLDINDTFIDALIQLGSDGRGKGGGTGYTSLQDPAVQRG
jgi:hypothetical protein